MIAMALDIHQSDTVACEQCGAPFEPGYEEQRFCSIGCSKRSAYEPGHAIRSLPLAKPPATRAECIDGPRPCPHVACRYHLTAEAHSCALDVADVGPQLLDTVGKLLGVTEERVRQIEAGAIRRLKARYGEDYLREIFERIHPEGDGVAADGEPDIDAPREVRQDAIPRKPRKGSTVRKGHALATEQAIVDHLTQHGPTHRSALLHLAKNASAMSYAVANLRAAGVITGGGTRHRPAPYYLRSADPSPRDATEEP